MSEEMDENFDSFQSNFDEIKAELREILAEDSVASQFKWALFCSALRSFKRESLLRPFPPFYKRQDEKLFEKLVLSYVQKFDVASMPKIETTSLPVLSKAQLRLLHWVLKQSTGLKLLPASELDETLALVESSSYGVTRIPKPSFILRLTRQSSAAERFAAARRRQHDGGAKTSFAFHGSALANFYSILNHGLLANCNKVSAFGEGTYLSSELAVSMQWSPLSTAGPSHLSIGDRFGCIALAQILHAPEGVVFGTRASCTADQLPEKYVIVQNDSLVQVQYLLVYAEQRRQAQQQNRPTLLGSVQDWLRNHKLLVMLLLYFCVLLVAGGAHRNHVRFYWNRFSRFWHSDSHYPDET